MEDASRVDDAKWNAYAACAVDLLPMAVLLLTPTGELLWANHRAQRMISVGEGIRIDGRKVISTDETHPTLTGRLMRLAQERLQHAEPRVSFFPLPRRSSAGSYQAALVDARSLTHEPSGAPATLLIIHDPLYKTMFDREALTQLYGFTRAESALAERLMTGRNLKEIASETGVSTHTVRAHLKRLFAKTGTTRQAELVLLLSAGVAGLQYARKHG